MIKNLFGHSPNVFNKLIFFYLNYKFSSKLMIGLKQKKEKKD